MIAAAAQRDEDAIGCGDELSRRIVGEDLRRDKLCAFRREAQVRVAIAQVNGTAFERRMSRERIEDRITARRCSLELLKIVEKLGEAADEEGHVGVEDTTRGSVFFLWRFVVVMTDRTAGDR